MEGNFKPQLLNEKAYPNEPRSLEEYLKYQDDKAHEHVKNVKMVEETVKKNLKKEAYHNPKIDPNSIKMAEEIKKKNEETEKVPGLRLYKKRNDVKQKILKENLNYKANILEINNKSTTLGKTVKTSEYDKKLISKMNETKNKKGGKENTNYINDILYHQGIEHQKEVQEKIYNKDCNDDMNMSLNSNVIQNLDDTKIYNERLFFFNFKDNFDELIAGESIELNSKLEINQTILQKTLEGLNMIIYHNQHEDINDETNNQMTQEDKDIFNEKKLCKKIFEELTSNNEKVFVTDLFAFLCCVIGIYRYYLLHKNQKDLKKLKAVEVENDLDTIIEEINKKSTGDKVVK